MASAEYHRQYYAKRSPEAKARKVQLQKERVLRNLAILRDYKASKGCADCGENDPIVLDFDHLDRSTKKYQLGDVTRIGWSIERMMEEIAKCEVVCANCHRRRTAKQLGWN